MARLSISFDFIYVMHNFDVVYRKSYFSRRTINFNSASFSSEQSETQSWDLRPLSTLFRYPEANCDLKFGKRTSIQNGVFRSNDRHIVSSEKLIFNTSGGSILKSKHTSRLVSMCRVKFWSQILHLANR